MSVTHITSCADVAGRVDYLIVGRGTKKQVHLRAGTDRMAAMTCDSGNIATFVREARSLARRHSRRVEGMTLIQSFALAEFLPGNPDDVQQANDLGWELAHRRYPRSRCLVITHTDGDGHDGCGAKVHNHIVVINHDEETGRAITTQGKRHYDVALVNDELMLEAGLSVVAPATKARDALEDHWAGRRLAHGVAPFDVQLGDRIDEALAEPSATDWSSYVKVLKGAGVEVRTEDRNVSRDPAVVRTMTGVTYVMLDTTGPRTRTRRRMASKLSPEFMHQAVVDRLAQKSRQPVQPTPVVVAAPSIHDRGRAMLQGLRSDTAASVEEAVQALERQRLADRAAREARGAVRAHFGVVQTSAPAAEAPEVTDQSVLNGDASDKDISLLFGLVTDSDRARWASEHAASQQEVEDRPAEQQDPGNEAKPTEPSSAVPRTVPTDRLSRLIAKHHGLDPDRQHEPSATRPRPHQDHGPSFV